MPKVNKKKKYVYDYPENREVSRGLQKGDQLFITEKTGYSYGHVNDMIRGRRKMLDDVKDLIQKVTALNAAKQRLK